MTMVADCIFCKIIAGTVPSDKIAETEHLLVFKDIAPKAPIHYLIIPKEHIQDVAACSDNEQMLLGKMMLVAKRLGAQLDGNKDFRIQVNNGHAAGQRVFHLHMHFLAGKNFSD